MSYQPFEVDSSWSWEKKKQEYKKAANAFKKNNPDATLKDFYTAYGQLRQPDGTGLQLKPKAKTTSPNYPDYQPKIKATTDVEIKKRILAEKALNEDSAKAWKKENITDWNNKNNPTGKRITADHPLFRRWEHRVKVSDPFWKSQEALDLPFRAGDVENLIYTNPKQWKLKDLGEQKYGSQYIFDVDNITGDITYAPRSKFNPYDTTASKRFTGAIPYSEIAKESDYIYEAFGIETKLKQKAFQELPSNLQALVEHGPNGGNGVNGVNGFNGVNGGNGVNGVYGVNGVNGKNGSNGASTILDRIKVPKKAQNVLSNKAVKGGLKYGRYGLAIGSVAITTLLANEAKAQAQTDPTLRNKALSFLRQTEAGLDWAGLTLAASGIGAPLAVPAEVLSMGVGLTTDLGEYLTSDTYKNRGVIRGRSGAKRAVKYNK